MIDKYITHIRVTGLNCMSRLVLPAHNHYSTSWMFFFNTIQNKLFHVSFWWVDFNTLSIEMRFGNYKFSLFSRQSVSLTLLLTLSWPFCCLSSWRLSVTWCLSIINVGFSEMLTLWIGGFISVDLHWRTLSFRIQCSYNRFLITVSER